MPEGQRGRLPPPVRENPKKTRWPHPRKPAHRPPRLDPRPAAPLHPPELLQQLLAVAHPAAHRVQGLRRQQQRRLRQHVRMLPARVVVPRNQVVEHRPRRGHDERRRHGGDPHPVRVHLRRQPLREALQRRLLRPVATAPLQTVLLRVVPLVRPPARPYRRHRRDVHDATVPPRQHIVEREPAQDERRVHVHRPRPQPPAHHVVLDGHEVRQRRVVHQHVHRPVGRARLLHQPLALRRLRDVHGDRRRLVPGLPDARHRRFERTLQRMIALVQRPRRAHHAPALRRQHPRDLRPDPPARPRHDHRLPVQLAHAPPPVPQPPHSTPRGERA